MCAQRLAVPGVPGAAGEAVPVKLLWPGGVGEAEVSQDGAREGPLHADMVNGLPVLREVEESCTADPGCTLESLE